MKVRIVENGKVVKEQKARNLAHFDTQRNTRSNVFKNKKAYTRKRKYKTDY